MKLTIDSVLEQAKRFANSSRVWDIPATHQSEGRERSGREQFREGIQVAEIGNPDACFQSAESIARLCNVVESGPVGVYSIRHVLAAIWYKSQGRMQDYERLLRIASQDLGDRLPSR